jgi:hypothetical protein
MTGKGDDVAERIRAECGCSALGISGILAWEAKTRR